jgi:cell division protein FtsL
MKAKLVLLSLLLVTAAVVVGREYRAARQLAATLAHETRESESLARHRAENARLVALQPSEAELARLREAAHEASRLRFEIAEATTRHADALAADERMRKQIAERVQAPPSPADEAARQAAIAAAVAEAKKRAAERKLAPPPPPEPRTDPSQPYEFGRNLRAEQWQNRGLATPENALETVLWSAAGGDLDALKTGLQFDAASRSEAEAVLAGLPAAARENYRTPEGLVTLFIAGDAPLGSLTVLSRQNTGPNTAVAYAALTDSGGAIRQVCLSFTRDGDRWRLTVPANAVRKVATRVLASGGGH